MSPFVSSLLALAALLATANGYCTKKRVGDSSETWVDVDQIHFMPPGVRVDIHENYCPPPMQVVGEDISACNKVQYGQAPIIDGPDYAFSPFIVKCSNDFIRINCPKGGDVNIRQYCA